MADFDPYHEWLGISPEERPINYYSLLSLRCFESNAKVISNAADCKMAYVRTFQTGPHAEASQKILNELSNARVTLLNPEQKAEYDAQLRKEQSARKVPLPPPVPSLKRPEPPVFSQPKRPEPTVQSAPKRPEPPTPPLFKRPESATQSAPKRPEPPTLPLFQRPEPTAQSAPKKPESQVRIIINCSEPSVKPTVNQPKVSKQATNEETAQGCCGCLFILFILFVLMALLNK